MSPRSHTTHDVTSNGKPDLPLRTWNRDLFPGPHKSNMIVEEHLLEQSSNPCWMTMASKVSP